MAAPAPPPSNSSPVLPDPLVRVRLTNVTYSLSRPEPGIDQLSSGFSHGQPFTEVPVIRVLGVTEGGQRACVNVHGAYPYMYIDYPKDRAIDPDSVRRFITRLGTALNVALRPPYKASNPPHLSKTANAIHSIVLCKGTELYGYRVGYSYFLRIAYLRPNDRYKLLQVLPGGAVCDLRARIYEGHLSFVLQFMADFGLGGCGWLDLADVRFRSLPDETDPPVSPGSEMLLPSRLRRWTTATTAAHYLHPTTLTPTSRTALEIDVHANAILNRLAIVPRELHKGFVELAQGGLGTDRKLVDSLEELWEDERRRRRAAGKSTSGEDDLGKLSYGTRLGSADEIPGKGVGWGSEPRWWAEVDARISQERETLLARAAAATAAAEDVQSAGHSSLPPRRLEDLLAHSAGRKESTAELARWDAYIPTTFRALTRGWPRTPLPSAAIEPLVVQSQHLPRHDVRALEDDSTAAADGRARRTNRDIARSTPGKGSAANIFSAPPTPVGNQLGDGKDAYDSEGEADVDLQRVWAATQRASQLEEDEERERMLAENEANYLHPPEADDGTFDAVGTSVEDDLELNAIHGRPVDPWGDESGFQGDLPHLGGRSRGRIKTAVDLSALINTTPRSAAATRILVPLSRHPPVAPAYPHGSYFSANSTRAERKSRSPGSAVRTSPLKRTAGGLATTSPRSPSTLRTVRYSQLPERGKQPHKTSDDDDDDDDDELEESPSASRVLAGRVKFETMGDQSPPPLKSSTAMTFKLGLRPAQPNFGSPAVSHVRKASHALAPVSSFAQLGRDRLPEYVLPTFVPPTFPQSGSPTPSDNNNKVDSHGQYSPPSSLREVDALIPPSPPDTSPPELVASDDALSLPVFKSTYVSPTATVLDSEEDDGDDGNDGGTATEPVSSPESEMLVMTSVLSPDKRPKAKPSPLARRPPRALVPATSALVPPSPEPDVQFTRPKKRVRYADADVGGSADDDCPWVTAVESDRKRELSSSLEDVVIPAAQPGSNASGAFAHPPAPTQVAGGRAVESVVAANVSSLDPSSSGENANVFQDVSVELGGQPLLLSPSLPSSSALYDRFGVHRGPYYSNPRDVPKPREYAGRIWSFSTHAREEDEEPIVDDYARQVGTFLGQTSAFHRSTRLQRTRRLGRNGAAQGHPPIVVPPAGPTRWEFGFRAVTRGEAVAWLDADRVEAKRRRKHFLESQHACSTQKNTQGFKYSQIDEASRHREKRYMSVMVLEILVQTRPGRLPVPEVDPIVGAFFAFQSDGEAPDNCYLPGCHIGMILVDPTQAASEATFSTKDPRRLLGHDVRPNFVPDEISLINLLIERVWEWDPDILSGWEVQANSWGYVTHRTAIYHEGAQEEFIHQLSPFKNPIHRPPSDYDADHHSLFQVEGRHVMNLWRMLKGELTLCHYSFENVAFHLLHRRVPKFTHNTVFELYSSSVPSDTSRALEHIFGRVLMVVEMLDLSEIISRNAEFARVYGVDFADVWQRGSQFKVEAMMFRIGKPESLLFLTPDKEEVGGQQSAECQPLVMEPQSAFYKDPVVVLDFQSLYPSIMLAYNICYSTCLGRADRLKDKHGNPTDRFGFSSYTMAPGDLEVLEEHITISPNGIMFVKPTLRKSLLAKMLGELLDTRVMIKQAMKGYKSDKNLMRTLNSRQLALKLLANVTYGYTSASFSGRMPHIQIADAIVQYGRESLEKAITLIHSTKKWGSHVVYGDTDSLFIHMPGKSKEDAFRIGHEIADAITARNPKPMKMKFEKVYLPCVLVAKKRYVGNKYEYPDDEPSFDDKGVETVRRDGIPAQVKEMEDCLKILFRTQDLSEVKRYMYTQWTNIMRGRVSIQDFTFSKEVHLGSYKEGSKPAHAIVAALRQIKDPGDVIQDRERVPYVVTIGEPGEPQYKRARRPEDLLFEDGLELDSNYYLERVLLPPLSRVLNLLGADVEQWFKTMPRPKLVTAPPFGDPAIQKAAAKKRKKQVSKLTDHYRSDLCFLCGIYTDKVPAICASCRADPISTAYALSGHLVKAETRLRDSQLICASCSSTPVSAPIACVSVDCPGLYAREGAKRMSESLRRVPAFIASLDKTGATSGPPLADVVDLTI